MKINRGYDADPLRPKEHTVLMETEPGKFTIVSEKSTEPIELLSLLVGRNHCVNLQQDNLVIVDEEGTIEERFENYTPKPQPEGEDITPDNLAIRTRWIENMMRFMVPHSLWQKRESVEAQDDIKNFLHNHGVEVAIRPDGCQAIVYREGLPLATWSCV